MEPTQRPDDAPAWGASNPHLASLTQRGPDWSGSPPGAYPPPGPYPPPGSNPPPGSYPSPGSNPPPGSHPSPGSYPAPGGGAWSGPPSPYGTPWGQPPQWTPAPRRSGGVLGYVVVALVTTLIIGSVAFAAGTGFGATLARAIDAPAAVVDHPTAPGEPTEFGLFWEAWDILKQNYVDQPGLAGKDLTYGAIKGLTEAIGDTGHTRFLTPDELAMQKADLSGEFAGVGAVLTSTDAGLVVQSVIPGAPAERGGIHAGDRILAVDGTDTTGKSVDEVVHEVRGTEGTQVTLTLLPKGETTPHDVTITRETITLPAVSWAMYPGTDVAVVRLEVFSVGSGDEVVAALKAAQAAGAKRIVFDLRNNPGGYVGDAVKVASQFLGDGVVYISQDGTGTRTEVPVTPGGIATGTPLVVLVDAGSASSAEIVSGAIANAGRAKLVGEKTFGTGTVLSQFDLSDGSALLVGTVEWLTPNGEQIWNKGIAPDVVVAIPSDGRIVVPSEFEQLGADGIKAAKDAQLDKAIELIRAQ